MGAAEWPRLAPAIWQTVAACLRVNRLARQARVADTGTRDSRAVLLLGSDGWVRHKENGVVYCLDATRCMFSSGNVSEKLRMAGLRCSGETIVDLFTGIGYFTLPLLLHAGGAKVIACEWNPHAVEALRRNVEANGLQQRCEVRPGDNRLVAPTGVADRVLLGLIPSSEGSWATALTALKPEGGWLHIHQNVKDSEEGDWCAAAMRRLEAIAQQQLGRRLRCRLHHVERVKWYAPHIRHLVLDVECRPAPEEAG